MHVVDFIVSFYCQWSGCGEDSELFQHQPGVIISDQGGVNLCHSLRVPQVPPASESHGHGDGFAAAGSLPQSSRLDEAVPEEGDRHHSQEVT